MSSATPRPESLTDLSDDLALALKLADAADLLSQQRFRAHDLHVTTKPDRTPVTDADQAVERSIRDGLANARPGDSILGEEYGETEGEADPDESADEGGGRASGAHPHRQWIVDPIDGTANFLRGVPVWATLIALAIDGVPVVGVVSAPALGRRWWAATGLGAFTTDRLDARGDGARAIRTSGISSLEDASLSYNSLKGWDDEGRLDELVALSRSVWRTRAYGEMWSYMMVAEGQLELAAEFDLKPYDMAALAPIVEEAGGRFSSADGVEGPWGGSALASNGLLHEKALSLIARGA
ncbi:histidinol phosphatase [Herbiconiux sp. CPCC 205716]|uniref:Histidinol phosphatase n=1 Tax=Herbiconiux gentiana TaxID=2970912 RepID=A0ABT2GJK2_9MICO|nr:inositol monophosphatase family protein [Herbiconiux gentiana]MCS5715099.1 histidinol phosphatase [Herbiconiux gentiana]